MILTFLKAKIHQATVTRADLNYQGSISIDPALLAESGILPNEQVHVLNIANGNRFVTYAIEGMPGTGEIGVNGAAARLVQPGDRVIVIAYAQAEETFVKTYKPRVLLVQSPDNRDFRMG